MEFRRIPHDENNSQLFVVEMDNADFVNPIEKTMFDIIGSYKAMRFNSFQYAHKHNKPSPIGIFPVNDIMAALEIEALKVWKRQYEKIMQTELPESIYGILNCTDKNAQIKIFKPPFELSTNSLQKFIFKAWLLYGFKFSFYSFEHSQKGLNEADLPNGFMLNDNNQVEVYGTTKLTKGELKNAIIHRKKTLAKFLDSGKEWHCFYYNYNSMGGKESGEIPHIHYISNNWTLDRKTVLEELSKRHHSFTSSVHINYKR